MAAAGLLKQITRRRQLLEPLIRVEETALTNNLHHSCRRIEMESRQARFGPSVCRDVQA
jgi:hypothetical protein